MLLNLHVDSVLVLVQLISKILQNEDGNFNT